MQKGVCILPVKTSNLLTVAGIVWLAAGVNILRLGVVAYGVAAWPIGAFVAMLVGTVAVFSVFHLKMFNKIVGDHVARIAGYAAPRTSALKFFDAKGYLMMAVMMAGGVALRATGIAPAWFVAFFYTGVGLALAVAGISFLGRRFGRNGSTESMPCPFAPRTWSHR